MQFDMPKNQSSIIKVIGVGGGGSNAVNHMYREGIKGVDFIVCNTDSQALDMSPVPTKLQLGTSLTEGRGAGSIPDVGKNAAIENLDEIQEILSNNTHMVFVTAGMGGGTGTGAAPVIAKAAKDMGILTVGIVTIPFGFEGKKRMIQAAEGLKEMRAAVDTLLVIKNDKLREIYGNLSLQNAFSQADNILSIAAKGIAEIISVTGAINVDMNDVNTVMRESGVAIMGQATAEGEDRAIKAAKQALESPLLNDNDIEGANYILLNITYGETEVMMDEISDITDFIQQAAGSSADVIWGHGFDESLGEKLSVTIIATGYRNAPDTGFEMDTPVRHVLNAQSEEETGPSKQSKQVGQMRTNPVELEAENDMYLKDSEEEAIEERQSQEDAEVETADRPIERFDLFGEKLEEKETEEENPKIEKGEPRHEERGVGHNREDKEVFHLDHSDEGQQDQDDRSLVDEKRLSQRVNAEVVAELNRERLRNLRDISDRLKTPEGLDQLEKEPAFKRRKVQLENVPHGKDSEVSRYTVTEERDENGGTRTGLRPNNSFLHDNVD